MKAFLIEDDPAVAESVKLAIELMSPDSACIHRASGSDAVAVVMEERPDVVLLDIGLPGEDGISVLRRIRAKSDVPVIVISGRTSPTDVVRGLQAGADDYLKKPFHAMELMARIDALTRRASTQDSRSPRLGIAL
jgi:two-component system KDP operon response regulator KdpE